MKDESVWKSKIGITYFLNLNMDVFFNTSENYWNPNYEKIDIVLDPPPIDEDIHKIRGFVLHQVDLW